MNKTKKTLALLLALAAVLCSVTASGMRAFQSFVSAVEDKGRTITVPSPGDT